MPKVSKKTQYKDMLEERGLRIRKPHISLDETGRIEGFTYVADNSIDDLDEFCDKLNTQRNSKGDV